MNSPLSRDPKEAHMGQSEHAPLAGVGCEHPDVQVCPSDGRRAIACFTCGRLFGWLNDEGFMVAYNPPDVPRRFRAATDEELD
jgi:hypothetical protein